MQKKFLIDYASLMSEWDWEKNAAIGLCPYMLPITSKKKAHWICDKGHKWEATVYHRGVEGTNCPYCANRKVLTGYNDLASQYPELMKEWDWGKNNELKLFPQEIYYGSTKKAYWICRNGHKWQATIGNRVLRGQNCPYCSNKKILAGYNDLKSCRPDLMKEWDFEKNTIDPEKVGVYSPKIAHWICERGHEYKKSIYARAKGKGCPICIRAKSTSFPEQCFYYYVKKAYPDAINGYKDIFPHTMELDIFIPCVNIGIEYDGIFWHNDKTAALREAKKYRICQEHGIKLYRIKEGEYSKDKIGFADCVYYITKDANYRHLSSYIYDIIREITFSSRQVLVINVEKDKNEILEYMTIRREDSLAYLFPEIAKDWHPTKNGKLKPDMFVAGSGEKVWWRCAKCGHEWRTSIESRTKHGCDACAREARKIAQKETLLSTRHILDNERCLLDWDYEENEYGPEHYTNGSGKKVHWKCHVCGHKWVTAICDRTRDYKNGCPLCSGKRIVRGVNDLVTRRPDLMKEWDWERNQNIDPHAIGVGSHLDVFWKCSKCNHVWKAKIYNRSNGRGCPKCASSQMAILHRNRAIAKIGSIKDTHPEIAAEWHPVKNGEKFAEMFSKGSDFKAWWICSKCQNEWQATIGSRTRGSGCPKCAARRNKS